MGARIIVNGEFQHHGVQGQKWGVITRYVGVNYIPVGRRSGSSARDVLKTVGSGVASAAKKTASATSNTAKAIVRGAKAYKQEHDAKEAEKRKSKFKSGKGLSKKDIANMSNDEIQSAINRRNKEQELYEMDHPVIAAGKTFVEDYVLKSAMDLGKDYLKKVVGTKVNEFLRDTIDKSTKYTPEQKLMIKQNMDLLNGKEKLILEAMSKAESREEVLSIINNPKWSKETSSYLKKQYNVEDNKYSNNTRTTIRNAIDSSDLPWINKLEEKVKAGVATYEEQVGWQEYNNNIRNEATFRTRLAGTSDYSPSNINKIRAGAYGMKDGNNGSNRDKEDDN